MGELDTPCLKVLTTSWSTGEPGPICYCIPEGSIPPADIQKYNMENKGKSFCFSSTTNTHFMNGETLLMVQEQCFSEAFAVQRCKQLC